MELGGSKGLTNLQSRSSVGILREGVKNWLYMGHVPYQGWMGVNLPKRPIVEVQFRLKFNIKKKRENYLNFCSQGLRGGGQRLGEMSPIKSSYFYDTFS